MGHGGEFDHPLQSPFGLVFRPQAFRTSHLSLDEGHSTSSSDLFTHHQTL